MSKNLKDLQWHSVALDGFPVSMSDNFQGFIGLEECTNYGLDRESKKLRKKKLKKNHQKSIQIVNNNEEKQTKRKIISESEYKEVTKKAKLENGFIVESCYNVTPSLTNAVSENNEEKGLKKKRKKTNTSQNVGKDINKQTNSKKESDNKKERQLRKAKLGEENTQTSDLTPEDMLTWAEFKLQEPILKAITELGFKNPTKIQQLSLPAAIHGRRDILGAAETGSGKTLAFGLPILSGILKLKEKADTKGLDVYEIPYKKTSAKKKNIKSETEVNGKYKKRKLVKSNVKPEKPKESSEDGYSSGDGVTNDEEDSASANSDKLINNNEMNDTSKNGNNSDEDDFVEEIEVPIKKRDTSTDEGNNSDSDDYIHLSDMLDSDDLTESSDEHDDAEQKLSDNDEIDNEEAENDCETESIVSGESDKDTGAEGFTDEEDSEVLLGEQSEVDEVDENRKGIGCVKVVDDIEMPSHIVMRTGKPLYALILTPTRELAIQISRHLIAAAKYTGIRVATIVGGMAAVKQERVLRCGPEIVVATPGRLWELITQGQPHLQQLDSVKFLAIDETDRMVERGHFDELQPLLERLNVDDAKKCARQNFVFSATLTLVHDLPSHMKGKKVTKRGKIINRKIQKMTPQQKIKRLIDMIGMTDPKVVDITTQNSGTAETLTECRITCSMDQKDVYLYYIIKRHPGRTIVFCNSIGSVKRLAQLFTILKCRPLPLHASMPQRQRLKNLERFCDDPHGVLIATDVAARGLDIPNVDHVIQYQVPRTAENYVHRSGRTARANKEGLNVLMVEPGEAYLYSKLCHTLNKTSEVPTFPVAAHILTPLKQIVSIARECDGLELKKRRAAQAHGWREKAARDMDMILDEDDVPVQAMDPSLDRALKAKRRQLDAMLSRPIFPKGFSFKYPTLNDPMALRNTEENALQVMKKAIESGDLKREKRKSKNAPLLKLEKAIKQSKK